MKNIWFSFTVFLILAGCIQKKESNKDATSRDPEVKVQLSETKGSKVVKSNKKRHWFPGYGKLEYSTEEIFLKVYSLDQNKITPNQKNLIKVDKTRKGISIGGAAYNKVKTEEFVGILVQIDETIIRCDDINLPSEAIANYKKDKNYSNISFKAWLPQEGISKGTHEVKFYFVDKNKTTVYHPHSNISIVI